MRPAKCFLREGDRVQPGPPYFCSHLSGGRRYGGYVGMPAVGARLSLVLSPGFDSECELGLWVLRCGKCRRGYVFEAVQRAA